jgi:uncharacterized protein (TIGR02217 family)
MAFFECEFPRTLSFKSLGGPSASTFVVGVESGAEQRNRNWAQFRRRYTVSLITAAARNADRQAFVDQLHTFFMVIGGKADAFRFYDHIDHSATRESVLALGGNLFQLQRTYSLGGRSFVRAITKPITSSVVDYTGNTLTDTVQLYNAGGALVGGTVDHQTGIVTSSFSPVTATFEYHIPVRLDTDDCQVQVEDSAVGEGNPIVSWNSLALLEVKPPNY